MGPFLIDGLDNVIALLNNVILLFALVFLYAITDFNSYKGNHKSKGIITGVLIGLFAILIMLNPWTHDEGVIFDTRSILLGATAVFFGPLSSIIAASMAAGFRILIGGEGVYVGVTTIVGSTALGLSWFKVRKVFPKMRSFLEYYVFGLILHVFVMVSFLLLPKSIRFEIFYKNLFPFVVIFPIITMLVANALLKQKGRLESKQIIEGQKRLLQASIDSAKSIQIFSLNQHYEYISFNSYHAKWLKENLNISISVGNNILDVMGNIEATTLFKTHLDLALRGEFVEVVTNSVVIEDSYFERIYNPLFDDKKNIVGVTVFAQDITSEIQQSQKLKFASYHDFLTGLYNRRYLTEKLEEFNSTKFLPLSVLIADINGLKIMNDAFGHSSGDELITVVANTIKNHLPENALLTRTGGDEFLVLIKNTSSHKAHSIIKNIEKELETKQINGMNVSVSFGVETKKGDENIQRIIKLAEDSMYRNKLYEIKSHRSNSIKNILNTLYGISPDEKIHSDRVADMCCKMGNALKMNDQELNLLKMISELHDIGKIAINESILNKPGKLTDEEWIEIKRHSELGYRIVSITPTFSEIAEDILSHHERYDGKGYPRGIKGEDIPIRARIVALCDSYDAMTNDRPYRLAMTHEKAIDEIIRCRGTQFDPNLTDIFVKLFK